jgi:hypothetical protein
MVNCLAERYWQDRENDARRFSGEEYQQPNEEKGGLFASISNRFTVGGGIAACCVDEGLPSANGVRVLHENSVSQVISLNRWYKWPKGE